MSDRILAMKSSGSAGTTESGDIYGDLPDYPVLAEAINDLNFGPFGIAQVLFKAAVEGD